MGHRSRPILILPLLPALLLAGCAGLPVRGELPDQPAVTVTAVAGAVELRQVGDTLPGRPLAAGDTIPPGSWLTASGGDAAVEVELGDGGRSAFRGAADLTVAYGRDEFRGSPYYTIFLNRGALESRLAPLRSGRYEVVTPVATAGVRGTTFEVIAAADGSTELYVDTGSVELTDNRTGAFLAVNAGEAATDLVDESPRRRAFLAWVERHRWVPEFLRERAERLRQRVGRELDELDGRLAGYDARGAVLADSIFAIHRERKAMFRDRPNSDTWPYLGPWLERLQALGADEVQLDQQLVRLNLQMNQYAEQLAGLRAVIGLTAAQQQQLDAAADRIHFAISNNRRLLVMGDPLREALLRLGDALHPGDEAEYYQPVE